MGTNNPALVQPVEHSLTASNNPRLCAPEHLTRPLESIAMADRLALIIDVDALGRSSIETGDRSLARVLNALSHVSVQVVVVAKVAMERAVALQRGISRSSFLDTERAVPQVRERKASLRLIVISNDPELLAPVGPEDRGFTLTNLPSTTHAVLSGESSLRLVLWWLVSRRATPSMARRL